LPTLSKSQHKILHHCIRCSSHWWWSWANFLPICIAVMHNSVTQFSAIVICAFTPHTYVYYT